MADTIKRYTKNKGYESLPRELLQSKEISLGAIGLICNMISYSNHWVLRKVELRNRFKNGAKAVDRIWDELVDAGYIIQFRKRVGKVYDYRYYFDEQPFDLESTQELLESNFEDGYMLYHKSLNHADGESVNVLDFIKCQNKENLDLSFWTSQNGKSKKPCNDAIPWSSHFGKSNLESPK
ncbi:hypothetical protein NHG29_07300, partial [Aerococcaceae bacterium NML160702]|nr:hypothetical protein [Aerococcaceae bacterium NML160702]